MTMSGTVKIRPGVGLLSIFPTMNYKPWFALGEMVDNSIQSYLENRTELRELHGSNFKLNIEIRFESGTDPRILVEDNAAGIFEKDIDRAFTPAVRPYDRSGIGQHGIGMKSSATWYSNFYTISTAALGESVQRTVTFDIAKIISEEIEVLPLETTEKETSHHGTRIVMRDLHQGIPTGATLGKIRNYLSSIYREFLRSGEVVITVGNEDLTFSSPALLETLYWPTDKGPDLESESRKWAIPIDFELSESWQNDSAPNKPEKPPRIRGWCGILKEGNTRLSGVALIWRKKVVVGAGSLAQGDEDTYRPGSIFGASTTFPFQRLIGEIDVSDLQATTFKDQIDWREGQEEEFQQKIREALDSGKEPLLRMARNYRSTLRSPATKQTVTKSLTATTEAGVQGFVDALNQSKISDLPPEIFDEPKDKSSVVVSEVPVPKNLKGSFRYEITTEPGFDQWLTLKTENSDSFVLRLNRAHPFMQSFANLPGADLDPVLRIAIAIAYSEIAARNSGLETPEFVRRKINVFLNGDLSSRISDKEIDNE